ncbi:MAG: MGMT family protein [Ramlibacter sp.]|nr:MGMT family protein [Cryobacterium sp.]
MPASSSGEFIEHVCAIVDSIPPGRVMTYGDVAAVLGSRGARAVGQIMARYGADLPWWRVIRAGGHPPAGHEDRALAQYRAEETPLRDRPGGYRIDYPAARWSPG